MPHQNKLLLRLVFPPKIKDLGDPYISSLCYLSYIQAYAPISSHGLTIIDSPPTPPELITDRTVAAISPPTFPIEIALHLHSKEYLILNV